MKSLHLPLALRQPINPVNKTTSLAHRYRRHSAKPPVNVLLYLFNFKVATSTDKDSRFSTCNSTPHYYPATERNKPLAFLGNDLFFQKRIKSHNRSNKKNQTKPNQNKTKKKTHTKKPETKQTNKRKPHSKKKKTQKPTHLLPSVSQDEKFPSGSSQICHDPQG